ncbi:MAG: hypothetical protein Q8R00_02075 [Candidatus Nanoarchaeia archaeon]|nr:hypothetical protein [Candidatus Nanoarchaeia archaeon]
MAEDLLSRLANPDRYNMLKDLGRIDENKIFEEQIDAQPRAQNLKPAKPLQPHNSQVIQQSIQKVEVKPLESASKHPEQNTLDIFAKPIDVKEEPKTFEEVKVEPKIEGPVQIAEEIKEEPVSISIEPTREFIKSYIPEPPREVQGKSITMEDIDVKKVESFFNRLIGGSL